MLGERHWHARFAPFKPRKSAGWLKSGVWSTPPARPVPTPSLAPVWRVLNITMEATWLWVRAAARRTRGSLVLIAMVSGLSAAVVLIALVGA